MEQTQLSFDRPTTPSNEINRPEVVEEEGPEFDRPHSQDNPSLSDMGTSCPFVKDNGSNLDCISSQVGNEQQKEAVVRKENNLDVESSEEYPSVETETNVRILSLDGRGISTDIQDIGNMKMESKDDANGEVVELKSANSTPSYEEDSMSLSQNSDIRPTTASEGETSSGKDDSDLLVTTDVSKSDSVGEADTNGTDGEGQWLGNSTLDADEKETTFTDGVVVPVSESETVTGVDGILNKDEATKAPVHFQKKVRGPELSANPPKKTQKRKAGRSKLCAQTGEVERGENKCHLVPNGVSKSKDATRLTDGSKVEEHIVSLDVVETNMKEDTKTKSDRVSVCAEDSDCDSDASSLSEDPTCWLERFRFVRKHLLTLAMVLSIIFGIILGSCLRDNIPPRDHRRIIYLRFPGELFVNILHLLVIPLMFSTLVSSVAAMDTQSIRKLGLRSLFYYAITTFIALVTGIILAMTAQPGKFDQLSGTGGPVPKVNPVDSVLDLLRNIFPDNIIAACFKKFTTQQVKMSPTDSVDPDPHSLNPYPDENSTLLPEAIMQVNTSELYRPLITQTGGTNFLGLVLVSVIMGAVISSMGQQGRPLHDFFGALSMVTIKITRIVMLYSPIGIFFLIAAKVVEVEFPQLTFHRLLMYTITVLVGLLGHGFVILPLVYFLMTRRNPVPFMYGISQGIITALATSSSAATLPILLRCLERKNRVSSHVARFVAPVGAVINLNGTALYQAMACIFIAQHRAVDLSLSQLALMSLIATLASIGTAYIPQAGLLTLVAVLTSVGLPQEDAALILTVDWILDRVSTMVNVIGDAVGAGLISHMTAKEESRKRRL